MVFSNRKNVMFNVRICFKLHVQVQITRLRHAFNIMILLKKLDIYNYWALMYN